VIPSFPVGNETRLRFYFASRDLTEAELATFMAGGGLPAGIGKDPAGVISCVYTPAEGAEATAVATRDGVGEYHLVVTPEANQRGQWWWRGQGLNAESKPQVTTRDFSFNATRAF
jgi:hypothetical protein